MTNSQDLLARVYQEATLVTASRRLARTLRQRYNEWRRAEGDAVWPTPEILPWDTWLEKLWDAHLFHSPAGENRVLLSPSQERALWRGIVERATANDALLDSAATADAAVNSWQLVHAWELDRRALEAAASEDTAAFLGWAKEFERICTAGGWIDRASLPDCLVSTLSALRLPSAVVLAGFEELSPQQQRFLDACRGQGAQVSLAEPASAPDTSTVVRVTFRDSREEIQAAARWARHLIEADAIGPIGVVIPGLSRMRNTVERIFTEIFHPSALLPGSGISEKAFNISAGRPLRAYPIIRAALSILELEPGRNESARVGNLLRSRHLSGGDAEWTARAMLDARLRRDGMASVSIDRLLTLAGKENLPRFTRTLARWRAVRDSLASRQKPSGWSRAFSLLLDTFGWPGDGALDSREYQVVAEWNAILSELACLDAVIPSLRYRDALQELKRSAADTIFQPEGASARIQILGLLEASGLHFEHLWIAGLHDEAWPAPARPDPFLPVDIQRKLRMPHASPERELEFARTITDRLLGSAEDVVVSYPLQDADGELGPSPLIQRLRLVAAEDLALSGTPLYRTLIRDSARMESIVDTQGPPVPPDVLQHGGARIFELQAACPFRAFAEWRLGARPLESPEPGLDDRARGILVHSALETLWRELQSHERLVSLPGEALGLAIERAVNCAIEDFVRRRGSDLAENFLTLEKSRLQSLLTAWLEIEAGRAAFEVVQPEGERYAEMSGIRFRVRLDRVDRVPDGRNVIVDYKTGNPTAASWEGPRPDSPQLPLYAVIHSEPLAGMLFGQVRVGAHRLIGVGDSAAISPDIKPADLEECRAVWREVLARLGDEFRAGHAAVNPKDANKTCRLCNLHALCRVREMNLEILSGGGEDE